MCVCALDPASRGAVVCRLDGRDRYLVVGVASASASTHCDATSMQCIALVSGRARKDEDEGQKCAGAAHYGRVRTARVLPSPAEPYEVAIDAAAQ